jgi:hypothetical protein
MKSIHTEADENASTIDKKSPQYLSKSLFIRGLQCHKSLYLEKFHPELKGETSAATQALFDSGHRVGEAAHGLFPGGVLVPYIENDIAEQLRQTCEAMNNNTRVIYEASFQHDGIFVKADILRKNRSGWELYEVKGGTSLKPVYVDDAALQYHVLTGAGVKVGKVFIAYINNGYVRNGELDVHQLFTCEDITAQVREKQPGIVEQLKEQRDMLNGKLPKIDIGPHCSDPYPCDYSEHCWQHIPADSVFDLHGNGVKPFKLYKEGIIRQKDIPLDMLNTKQRQQVQATLKKRNTIERGRIEAFLGTLKYPLYFLDFETFMSAIPLYDGAKPYQQLPFQYSLHYRKKKGGRLFHSEFLAEPGIDPRKPLVESLAADMPENACIMTYNMAFEKRVLSELAARYPEHRQKIDKWKDNIVDLMVPFRQRDLYYWQFKGSYSIKNVLPVLAPELSYEGLEIADGGAAMSAYHRMCAVKDDPKSLAKIRKDLLAYCKLDTLAMVRILDCLGDLRHAKP